MTLKYDPAVVVPVIVRHGGICKPTENGAATPELYRDSVVYGEGQITAAVTCPNIDQAIMDNSHQQLLVVTFRAVSVGDAKLLLDPDQIDILSSDKSRIPVQVLYGKMEIIP